VVEHVGGVHAHAEVLEDFGVRRRARRRRHRRPALREEVRGERGGEGAAQGKPVACARPQLAPSERALALNARAAAARRRTATASGPATVKPRAR
jgi:hypothetical protein